MARFKCKKDDESKYTTIAIRDTLLVNISHVALDFHFVVLTTTRLKGQATQLPIVTTRFIIENISGNENLMPSFECQKYVKECSVEIRM